MAAKSPCVIAHMTVVPDNYSPDDVDDEEDAVETVEAAE